MKSVLALLVFILPTLACAVGFTPMTPTPGGAAPPANDPPPVNGDTATVDYVVDGDTIEVTMNGVGYRVRYVGVNTPERDEACYQAAKDANAALVTGQTVTLVQDESNTDRYGRLLRYIYVGGTLINAELVRQGWAEAVEYPPDTLYTADFRIIEQEAAAANLGCHPTGIFNDGSQTR